jgi:hypothetical protein
VLFLLNFRSTFVIAPVEPEPAASVLPRFYCKNTRAAGDYSERKLGTQVETGKKPLKNDIFCAQGVKNRMK